MADFYPRIATNGASVMVKIATLARDGFLHLIRGGID
jgi:hypothetical protein